MKRQLLFLPCLLFFLSVKAQTINARSAGLGGITAITAPRESLYGNISGLTSLKSKEAMISSIIPFGMPEVFTGVLSIMSPLKSGYGTIGFSRFGNKFYNKTSSSFGYAHKIEFVSLGISTNINRYSIIESGSRTNIVLNFGGMAEVFPGLSFGAHIVNFSLSGISKETGEKEPVVLAAGLCWQPVKSTLLLIEASKETNFNHKLSAALEYTLLSILKVRTGYSANPGKFHIGLGVNRKNIKLEYAVIVHPVLPSSHYLSITFSLKNEPV